MDAAIEPPWTGSRRVPRAARAPRPRCCEFAAGPLPAHHRRTRCRYVVASSYAASMPRKVPRHELARTSRDGRWAWLSIEQSADCLVRPTDRHDRPPAGCRCNRLQVLAHQLHLSDTTAWFDARDSTRARLQSVGVAFGRYRVVCRAVLVGWGEDCTMAFVSFNGRFFRMSRDVASPPGEFVHRSGFIAANTATWSHAAGHLAGAVRFARSLRVAGMDLPLQPALSHACDGQP